MNIRISLIAVACLFLVAPGAKGDLLNIGSNVLAVSRDAPPDSDCFLARPDLAGCDSPECQSKVCALDTFCCDVHWDSLCVTQAEEICGSIVAVGDTDPTGTPLARLILRGDAVFQGDASLGGVLDMKFNNIVAVGNPINPADAANKGYVDSRTIDCVTAENTTTCALSSGPCSDTIATCPSGYAVVGGGCELSAIWVCSPPGIPPTQTLRHSIYRSVPSGEDEWKCGVYTYECAGSASLVNVTSKARCCR